MRIISQDGCYDMPYEQAMLLRFKEGIYLMSNNFAGVEIWKREQNDEGAEK